MTDKPLVDRGVESTGALLPLGLLAVIVLLGLAILGAWTVSSRLRGLDQSAPQVTPVEAPAEPG